MKRRNIFIALALTAGMVATVSGLVACSSPSVETIGSGVSDPPTEPPVTTTTAATTETTSLAETTEVSISETTVVDFSSVLPEDTTVTEPTAQATEATITETEPPEIEPPVTETTPAETEPVSTEPAVTTPAVTEAPVITTQKPVQTEAPAVTEAVPVFEAVNKTMYVTGNPVNIRASYSIDSKKLGSMTYGSEIKVTGYNKDVGFYKVTYNSSEAYIMAQYLSDTKPQAQQQTTTQQAGVSTQKAETQKPVETTAAQKPAETTKPASTQTKAEEIAALKEEINASLPSWIWDDPKTFTDEQLDEGEKLASEAYNKIGRAGGRISDASEYGTLMDNYAKEWMHRNGIQ